MELPSLSDELRGVDLGDERLNRRAVVVGEAVADAPTESFPDMAETEGELEALYRFFSNDSVEPEALLEPHVEATIRRCAKDAYIRVAHDTSAFQFEGDREGLGELGNRGRGFYGHFSLAIGPGEDREPSGVLHSSSFIRTKETRRKTRTERTALLRATPRAEKESSKWERSAQVVEEKVCNRVPVIHVMDREANQFVLIAIMQRTGARFVIRGKATRRVNRDQPEVVADALDTVASTFLRRVSLSARSKPLNNQVRRDEREATLHVRGVKLTLGRPTHSQSEVSELRVNVVQVIERDAPKGEEPIEWTLYTSEPIDTVEDLVAVVDHYRARWRIEEFFKALKSGCRFEARQLTDFDGLVRALQIFSVVAWRLLALRVLSRTPKSTPARRLFSNDDLAVLRFLAAKRKHPLPKSPTVRNMMLAIAAIGGHLKRNGEPGWMTLGRGYDKYMAAREGWLAAQKERPEL